MFRFLNTNYFTMIFFCDSADGFYGIMIQLNFTKRKKVHALKILHKEL